MEEAEREREEGGRLRSIFGFSSTSSSLETTSAISRNNGCFVVPFLPLSHARRQRLRRDRRRPRFLSLATRGRKKAEAEGGSQRIYSFFFRCRHCRDGKVRAEKKLGRYFELFHFFSFNQRLCRLVFPRRCVFLCTYKKPRECKDLMFKGG